MKNKRKKRSKKVRRKKIDWDTTFPEVIKLALIDMQSIKTLRGSFIYATLYRYKLSICLTFEHLKSLFDKGEDNTAIVYNTFKSCFGEFGYTYKNGCIDVTRDWYKYPLKKRFFDDVVYMLLEYGYKIKYVLLIRFYKILNHIYILERSKRVVGKMKTIYGLCKRDGTRNGKHVWSWLDGFHVRDNLFVCKENGEDIRWSSSHRFDPNFTFPPKNVEQLFYEDETIPIDGSVYKIVERTCGTTIESSDFSFVKEYVDNYSSTYNIKTLDKCIKELKFGFTLTYTHNNIEYKMMKYNSLNDRARFNCYFEDETNATNEYGEGLVSSSHGENAMVIRGNAIHGKYCFILEDGKVHKIEHKKN